MLRALNDSLPLDGYDPATGATGVKQNQKKFDTGTSCHAKLGNSSSLDAFFDYSSYLMSFYHRSITVLDQDRLKSVGSPWAK